ncbi:MAG: hypothetical protein BWY71_01334 [Planctomycetes bacterium ADurb.Bin412]|nr:MAG: hypothetical protein BWY71_01334 [Planctomycetes bacterium ADurb.Bin412]
MRPRMPGQSHQNRQLLRQCHSGILPGLRALRRRLPQRRQTRPRRPGCRPPPPRTEKTGPGLPGALLRFRIPRHPPRRPDPCLETVGFLRGLGNRPGRANGFRQRREIAERPGPPSADLLRLPGHRGLPPEIPAGHRRLADPPGFARPLPLPPAPHHLGPGPRYRLRLALHRQKTRGRLPPRTARCGHHLRRSASLVRRKRHRSPQPHAPAGRYLYPRTGPGRRPLPHRRRHVRRHQGRLFRHRSPVYVVFGNHHHSKSPGRTAESPAPAPCLSGTAGLRGRLRQRPPGRHE